MIRSLFSSTRSAHFLGLVLTLIVVGCGGADGPEVATVTGKVTVDGNPVKGLEVYFQGPEGPSAMGITDDEGNYELFYTGGQAGAVVGENTVQIVGKQEELSEQVLGEMAAEQAEKNGGEVDLETLKGLPRLPARYNSATELKENVQPGRNEFNFELTTK